MTVSVLVSEDEASPHITPDSATRTIRPATAPLHTRIARAFHVLTQRDTPHAGKASKDSPLSLATSHSLPFARSAHMPPHHTPPHDIYTAATPATAASTASSPPVSSAPLSPLRAALVAVGVVAALLVIAYGLSALSTASRLTAPPHTAQPAVGHTLAQWRAQHPAAITPSPARADHTFHTLAAPQQQQQPAVASQPAAADTTFKYNNAGNPATRLPAARMTRKQAVAQQRRAQATKLAQQAAQQAKAAKQQLSPEQQREKADEVRAEAERMLQAMRQREEETEARVGVATEVEGAAAGSRGVKTVAGGSEYVVQQQRDSTSERSADDAALQALRWSTEPAHTQRPRPQLQPQQAQSSASSHRSQAKGM